MNAEQAARWFALPTAVIAVSASSILIRLTTSAPITTATYRMCGAGLLLLAVAAASGLSDVGSLNRRTLAIVSAAGALLGVHFALWTVSLFHTSVASAVFLVDTHPVFVAVVARLVLGERTGASAWAGVALATAGGLLIAGSDTQGREGAWAGDAMAVGAAIAFGGYLVIGRYARQALSTATYAGVVYGIAGLLLLLITLAAGASLQPNSPRDPLLWLGLILVPTLGGHTVFNWALRHVAASIVGVAILGEPVISTLLAWLVLGERPPLGAVIGGFVVLIGVFTALRSRTEPQLRTAGPGAR